MTNVPVWLDALHVGDVTVADAGALGFSYSEAWLATEGAFPLSLTLPLDATAYTSEVISPWLANLLPEEEQLNILTRSLGLDRADILAVLKAIGGDTAGALSFGAPSERAAWTFTPLTEFYSLDDPGRPLSAISRTSNSVLSLPARKAFVSPSQAAGKNQPLRSWMRRGRPSFDCQAMAIFSPFHVTGRLQPLS